MTWTSFVGAGALVPRDGDLLFVRQRRAYGVHWELPGGYYDGNESLEDAARREVLEETGVAVEIDSFVCTLVWQRDHDRRRIVQTWFSASLLDNTAEPTPQIEEDIDAVAFLDPLAIVDEIHPLERAIIERWRPQGETGFHIRADVTVCPDGTQTYQFRV
jgi:ADP-ribose pyrophosphatase YjhB (NUDIX family)